MGFYHLGSILKFWKQTEH